jgi:hypothetical protein
VAIGERLWELREEHYGDQDLGEPRVLGECDEVKVCGELDRKNTQG